MIFIPFDKIKKRKNIKKYDNYLITSNYKILSLDDLSVFGINKNFLHEGKKEDDCFYIPYINSKEKENIKKNDWQYKINKYNFRESWNFETDKQKIGFFGCSFTFGEGLEYNSTFPAIVSKQTNLNSFNFGVGGSSLHRIVRTFSAVNKIIDLNYAVFTLPHWNRQMYINDEGEFVNLIPQWGNSKYIEINEQLTNLTQKHYIIQTISFLSWINDLAETKKIKIFFSSWDKDLHDLCQNMYPDKTIDIFLFLENDYARDKMHPGEKSNQLYAKKIINYF